MFVCVAGSCGSAAGGGRVADCAARCHSATAAGRRSSAAAASWSDPGSDVPRRRRVPVGVGTSRAAADGQHVQHAAAAAARRRRQLRRRSRVARQSPTIVTGDGQEPAAADWSVAFVESFHLLYSRQHLNSKAEFCVELHISALYMTPPTAAARLLQLSSDSQYVAPAAVESYLLLTPSLRRDGWMDRYPLHRPCTTY